MSSTGVLPAPANTDLVIVAIVLFLLTALVVNVSLVFSALSFIAAAVVMAYGFGFDVKNLLDEIPIPTLAPAEAEAMVAEEDAVEDAQTPFVAEPTTTVLEVPPTLTDFVQTESRVRLEAAPVQLSKPREVAPMPTLEDIFAAEEAMTRRIMGA